MKPGYGVPREPEEKTPDAPAAAEATPDEGDGVWGPEPTLATQLLDMPSHCKRLPPKADVFDLSDPQQKDAYNAILARTEPMGAPGVMVKGFELQKHEGRFIVFVTYQEVRYKKIVNRSKG